MAVLIRWASVLLLLNAIFIPVFLSRLVTFLICGDEKVNVAHFSSFPHCIGGWVGYSGGVDVWQMRNILCYPCCTVTISHNKLTKWNRVLPEKQLGPQLVKKFLAFYGTQKFITAFTRAQPLSLS